MAQRERHSGQAGPRNILDQSSFGGQRTALAATSPVRDVNSRPEVGTDDELPEICFPILYVRSPVALAFFDDSIFSPPLRPRMLTKPRTVCCCQPVVFYDLGQCGALRALHHRDHLGLLVGAVRLRLGCFLAGASFAGLALLPGWRFGFAAVGSGVAFTESIGISLTSFSLPRIAVVEFITPVARNSKSKSASIGMRRMTDGFRGNCAGMVPFLRGQNKVNSSRGEATTRFRLDRL